MKIQNQEQERIARVILGRLWNWMLFIKVDDTLMYIIDDNMLWSNDFRNFTLNCWNDLRNKIKT